jgi:hypothetical protein
LNHQLGNGHSADGELIVKPTSEESVFVF